MELKHEVISIENYSLLFEELKGTSKIVLKENVNFIYTPIKIGGYMFKIDKTLKIDFGCQTLTMDVIKSMLNQIKGEENFINENWYVHKHGNKLCNVNDIVDKTGKYLIDKNMKAHNISDYNIEQLKIEKGVLKLVSNYNIKYWRYKTSYDIPANNNPLLISKIEYIIEIYNTLNQLTKQ